MNYTKNMWNKIKNIIQKHKVIFSILLVNILLYVVHIFTAKHVITLILALIPSDYKSGGFGGLALLLFIGQLLLIVYGLLGSFIVWLLLSKKRYVILSFFVFILLFVVEIGIDTFFANQEQDRVTKAFQLANENAKREAALTQLEFSDFTDEGEFDNEGYLTKLHLTLKVKSNRDVTVNNPLLDLYLLVSGDQGDVYYFRTTSQKNSDVDRGDMSVLTYNLKPGLNEVKLTVDNLNFMPPMNKQGSISKFFEIKLLFTANREGLGEDDQANAPKINIIDLSGKTFTPDYYSLAQLHIRTKEYKVRLK